MGRSEIAMRDITAVKNAVRALLPVNLT